MAALSPSRLRSLRRRLLGWYEAHQQPFPWRTARDPYAAMVAAVAAQQTQMSRVLEIYGRWMAAYPTVEALASAERADVLRTWGRAGYPRRAVHLHEAARRCVEVHGGAVPRDPEALRALPGVGPFTSAIVRTFGFDDDAPAVDTNVVRVIGRVVFGDLQPARETSTRDIEEAAARLFPRGEGARWNPALMDYGARVCTPKPRCEECVVASLCAARARFASGEVATPVRAQGRFEGSDRQQRGRVMHVLREAGGPLSEATLLRRLVPPGAASKDASREERARVRRLLAALVEDGLAWRSDGRVGLGGAPVAVAAGRGVRAARGLGCGTWSD